MSSTQEKLAHSPRKHGLTTEMVAKFNASVEKGDKVVYQAPKWVAMSNNHLQALIDSAKREGYEQGYIECGMKWNKVAEEVLSSMKETREHIEQTNAQLEQSEESE